MNKLNEIRCGEGHGKLESKSFDASESEDTYIISSDEESSQMGYNPTESDRKNQLEMHGLEPSLQKQQDQSIATFIKRYIDLEKNMAQRDDDIIRLAEHCCRVERKISKQNEQIKEILRENNSLRLDIVKRSLVRSLLKSINPPIEMGATMDNIMAKKVEIHSTKDHHKEKSFNQSTISEVMLHPMEAPLSPKSDDKNKTITNRRKKKRPIKITCTYDPEVISLSALNFSYPHLEDKYCKNVSTQERDGSKSHPSNSDIRRIKNSVVDSKSVYDEKCPEHHVLNNNVLSLISKSHTSGESIKVQDNRQLNNSERITFIEKELQACVDIISEVRSFILEIRLVTNFRYHPKLMGFFYPQLRFKLANTKENINPIRADKERYFDFSISGYESSFSLKYEQISFLKQQLNYLKTSVKQHREAKKYFHSNDCTDPSLRLSRNSSYFLNLKSSQHSSEENQFSLRAGFVFLKDMFWPPKWRQQTINDGFKYFNLGILQKNASNYEKALSLYHLALVCQQKGLSDYHPACGETLEEIGAVQEMIEEKQMAIHALDEALSIYKINFGDNSNEVIRVEDNIRSVAFKMNHWGDNPSF